MHKMKTYIISDLFVCSVSARWHLGLFCVSKLQPWSTRKVPLPSTVQDFSFTTTTMYNHHKQCCTWSPLSHNTVMSSQPPGWQHRTVMLLSATNHLETWCCLGDGSWEKKKIHQSGNLKGSIHYPSQWEMVSSQGLVLICRHSDSNLQGRQCYSIEVPTKTCIGIYWEFYSMKRWDL